MTVVQTQKISLGGTSEIREERPVGRSMRRGFLNTCPACGQGKLFAKFLRTVDHCACCDQRLDDHRADDLPPYIVITIVGHVMVGGYMATDLVWSLNSWQHLAIWAPLTILASVALMQPVKGAVIGLQWALRMHGFGDKPDAPEDRLPDQAPPR
ncbi:Uncharacterized conserved protein, DUF983 family [Rhizobium sp. RU20A]|uniref:DUF983 domain-containing protein n=1 Tax=Rhizobium sp. RU20A TaxID=1907412 RepID=UPI000955FB35|nr:DUF983 domain-containing protein [Rhizobium sp. RU20A]SIP98056.1 Uncharacterized conserved protein, DUF983 family [Rhizobium sp. RU20A]